MWRFTYFSFLVFPEMNILMMQMRHTAHELRVTLDHVLQGGEATGASSHSQNESVSFLGEQEAEMGAGHSIPEVRAIFYVFSLIFYLSLKTICLLIHYLTHFML